jgi:hypothetical protein
VSLEPGGGDALLAGDGGRHALAAYAAPQPHGPYQHASERCRLAVLDLRTATVERTYTVCTSPETVVALAAGRATSAVPATAPARTAAAESAWTTIAYVALWRQPAAGEQCALVHSGRIVAIRTDTGAVLAAAPLGSAPGALALHPSVGTAESWLYALRAAPDPEMLADCRWLDYSQVREAAVSWELLALDPVTLHERPVLAVTESPRQLAIAPDGRHAYALVGMAKVLHLDLVTGDVRELTWLPALGAGLVVADEWLYLASPFGDGAWSVRRRDGRVRALAGGAGGTTAVALSAGG